MFLNSSKLMAFALLTMPAHGVATESAVTPNLSSLQLARTAELNKQLSKETKIKLDNILLSLKDLDRQVAFDWMTSESAKLTNEAEALKEQIEVCDKEKKDLPQDISQLVEILQFRTGLIKQFASRFVSLGEKPQLFIQALNGETEEGSNYGLAGSKITKQTNQRISGQTAEINNLLNALSLGPAGQEFYGWITDGNTKLTDLLTSSNSLESDLNDPQFRASEHKLAVIEPTKPMFGKGIYGVVATGALFLFFVVLRELNKWRIKSSGQSRADSDKAKWSSKERRWQKGL